MDSIKMPTKLSNLQIYILLTAYAAGSPQAAYLSLNQTANMPEAIKILDKMGYISATNNGIELTQNGTDYIESGNYAADGVLTDSGNSVMKEYDPTPAPTKTTPGVQPQTERFALLKSMII